jgi:hypothetical protein
MLCRVCAIYSDHAGVAVSGDVGHDATESALKHAIISRRPNKFNN